MIGDNLGSVAAAASKKGLTFSSFLSGASKTLNFVNQAIPVYYQTKPIFKNAKTLINVFKKTSEPIKNDINQIREERKSIVKPNTSKTNYNNPTFFQ